MKGSWVGVYVDRGKAPQGKEKELLEKNAELVRQLGGEFLTIQDPSLVDGLLKVAKRQNVTQIIVGKTQRNFLQSIFSGGSIVQKLLRKSGDIDVYVVATDKGKPLEHKKIPKNYTFNLFPWGEFGWVTAVTILSWLLAGFLSSVIGYSSIGIIFLMAVTLSGLVLSRPSVLTLAVLLSLIHNFFFIPPVYAFNIDKPEDILMFIMYFLAASTVGHLTNKLKMQNKMIQNREDKTNLLFRITRQISESQDLTSIMNLAAEELGKKSYGEVCIILFENDKPAIHPASTFYPEEKEQAVATWIKNNDSVAGRYTETLPASEGIYFPIHSRGKVVGVLGINFPKDYKLDFEEKNFIYTLVNQFASGIERELLHESRKKLEFLERSEKLQRSLFDSVSHELKTPLTTIKAAASALTEEESSKAVGIRKQ
jgi:two-component system sensor histidine kinase KdpD